MLEFYPNRVFILITWDNAVRIPQPIRDCCCQNWVSSELWLRNLIAVIAVISGLTHKRGERVNPALYWPFRLVCMPFKTKEYLTGDSTAITAIRTFQVSKGKVSYAQGIRAEKEVQWPYLLWWLQIEQLIFRPSVLGHKTLPKFSWLQCEDSKLPKTLTQCLWPKSTIFPILFMTWPNIWYPIYDMTPKSIPYFRPAL